MTKTRDGGTPARCSLCAASEAGGAEMTRHHLVPRSTWGPESPHGGGVTIPLCLECHWMVHQLWSNEYLATHCSTLEALRTDPLVVAWLEFRRTLLAEQSRERQWLAIRRKAHAP